MRTRRRSWLSEDLPNSQDPYSGVSGRRPLCRVTASRTRPNRCATLLLAFIVPQPNLPVPAHKVVRVRLVIAQCTVDYVGRLTAHLPSARRLLLFKADGSVSVHADDRAYKPLNWMSPPCQLVEEPGRWVITNRRGETLTITIETTHTDISHELGSPAGLEKDGVEAHLQELLA